MGTDNNQISSTPSALSNNKYVKALKLSFSFLKFLVKPESVLERMVEDEFRRVKYNKLLSKGQMQSISKNRIILFTIFGSLTLIHVVGLLMIVFGAGTKGSNYKPLTIITQALKSGKLPNIDFLINPYIPAAILAASIIGYIVYFLAFEFQFTSLHKRMALSLHRQFSNTENSPDVRPYWYYPGKMLYLDLVGCTDEEIIKNKAFWLRAGMEPSPEVCKIKARDGTVTNQYVFTAGASKPSNSTMIYDRYDEWTNIAKDDERLFTWFLGESVLKNEYTAKPCFDDFSLIFVGTSGAGKTEAMKCWLTAFLVKHPWARAVIVDLKGTADWDVFAPYTESSYIVKDHAEGLLAISYFDDLFNKRQKYMREKGYKNIKAWSEEEKIPVPPVLLIIDEFPQFAGPLRYDMTAKKDGTPANMLFKLLTMGRSYGLWVILGSQYGTSEHIPSEINKNVQVKVALRTGSEHESNALVNTLKAHYIGKEGDKNPDGSDDKKKGYAYVNNEKDYVRFWYMDDWIIAHEFKKYGVSTMVGADHTKPREMKLPADVEGRLAAYNGNLNKFHPWAKQNIVNFKNAVEKFKKSYAEMEKTPPKQQDPKRPLGQLWRKEETVEAYIARSRAGDTASDNEKKESDGGDNGGRKSKDDKGRQVDDWEELAKQYPTKEPSTRQIKKPDIKSYTIDDDKDDFLQLANQRREARKTKKV